MKTAQNAPNEKFKKWLDKATPLMRLHLAMLAGTSRQMFRQWASGRRALSAEMAGEVSKASLFLSDNNPKVPEPLTRGDLCDACAKCEHFLESLKNNK